MDDSFMNLGEEVVLTLLWQSGASESATVCFVIISLTICYLLFKCVVLRFVCVCVYVCERERERESHSCSVMCRGRPIIGADIKHFTDYRYRPF